MNLSADNLSADESTRILVGEDEPQLAAVLCDYLKASGYETCHLADGEAVLDTFTRWQPGLVLLDLMLPGADGVSLCRELRATRCTAQYFPSGAESAQLLHIWVSSCGSIGMVLRFRASARLRMPAGASGRPQTIRSSWRSLHVRPPSCRCPSGRPAPHIVPCAFLPPCTG